MLSEREGKEQLEISKKLPKKKLMKAHTNSTVSGFWFIPVLCREIMELPNYVFNGDAS